MKNSPQIGLVVKKGSEEKPVLANKEVHNRFVRNIFNLIGINIDSK